MSAPNKTGTVLAILILGLAGAIGLAAVQLIRLGEVGDRVDLLERRLGELEGRAAAGERRAGSGEGGDLAELERAQEALGRRVDALLLRTTSNTKRLDFIEAGDIGDLGIEAFIEERIASSGAGKGLLGGRYPDLDRVAGFLGLSAGQQARVAEIIDRSKDRVLKVMETAHGDGRTLVGEVADVLSAPMTPENKLKQMQNMLFGHGPPGSEDSYFTHVMEIRVEALDAFQGTLTAEQQAKWKTMGHDLFAIRTGYSPFKSAAETLVEGDP